MGTMNMLERLRCPSLLAAVLAGLLLVTLLAVMPHVAHAFVVEGDACGLVVTAAEDYVDVTNLNPGDTESSYLIAQNEGEGDFRYFFNLRMIGSTAGYYRGTVGRHLDEVMQFSVSSGGVLLFCGPLADFRELDMGWLSPGQKQRIDITTHLPGEETGNEYQGASLTVRCEFWAARDPTPPPQRAWLTVGKFHDANRDGKRDEGEAWIEGWPILINGIQYQTPITNLRVSPGRYTILEVEQEGWTPTTPTRRVVTLSPGQSTAMLFGNYRESDHEPEKGRLLVRKFHDLNADGTWDEDEPEIMNWTVFIDGEEHQTPVSLQVESGSYHVSEELREGWEATTATSLLVTVEEGEAHSVIFGNVWPEEMVIPPPPPQVPDTGEIPPTLFYSLGAMLVGAGLVVSRRHHGQSKE